jgi:hypothetical protein
MTSLPWLLALVVIGTAVVWGGSVALDRAADRLALYAAFIGWMALESVGVTSVML